MSEISYFEIEEALATILKTDALTKTIGKNKLRVEVEEEFIPMPDKCPWVGIYLDSWDTPADEERIGGGTRFTTYLTLELVLFEYALENRTGAILRDRLLQKVKEVLKKKDSRKISSNVLITRFQGGEFDNAKNEEGFFKGATIKLELEVRE